MKKTLTMLAVLSISSLALNMDDCSVGRTVYIDNLIDRETIIEKCDYSDDTIKVRLNNGETKWLKPSELMSPATKKVEDYLEEKAVDFLVGCLFGDTCQEKK